METESKGPKPGFELNPIVSDLAALPPESVELSAKLERRGTGRRILEDAAGHLLGSMAARAAGVLMVALLFFFAYGRAGDRVPACVEQPNNIIKLANP